MKESTRLVKIQHYDKEISSFINDLDEVNLESSYYLLLLVGNYNSGKKKIMGQFQKKLGGFMEVDLREVISLDEEQCFKNIDELFRTIGETEKNLVFRHGDALAGEYTGFTYSSTRYATPQEKYLLKKINSSEKFVIINLDEHENIDKTLERYAQTAIIFDKPSSFFGKLFWRLRQIKVNGHTFANKRPSTAMRI